MIETEPRSERSQRPDPGGTDRTDAEGDPGDLGAPEAPDAPAALDAEQARAVAHRGGPLIIAAGAGTGKTRTLTARVARLLDDGVDPSRVLLLTFTRRAARVMAGRAAAVSGDPEATQRLWSGTFHAVAHRLVAEHAHHLGLTDVTVLDPDDVIDLLDLMREEHGLSGTDRRTPSSRAIADIYTRAVNTGASADTVMAAGFPWCLDHADAVKALLRDYGRRKRARGLLDLDDVLLCWRALLADDDVGARLRARWDHVLVDEYQDVNGIQVDIVRLLRPDGVGLTVVGDDAQAVYGFRGADPDHLMTLARDLPDAEVVRLERNFRSTQQILDLANAARPGEVRLDLHADRVDRGARPAWVQCANGDDEARRVADAVLAAHIDGLPLSEQAVLFRTGTHSNLLEVELTVRGIPFVKFGGIGYLQTAHVRDLLAGLRIALNPADEVAWYRLLTRHRAIGKVHARAMAALLCDDGAADLGARSEQAVAAAPPRARTAVESTLQALLEAHEAANVAATVRATHRAVRPLVRQQYVDWARRIDDVDRLAELAEQQHDLRGFVAEQTIDPAEVGADWAKSPHLDEDFLVLSTVHSAKGLEWTNVHVLRACDGAFPSDMALTSDAGLAEEQRLFYVALTRARDQLSVYSPQRLPTHPTSLHARHVNAKPSRFLDATTTVHMDRVHPEPVAAPARCGAPAPRSGPTVALPALDGLFD